MSFARTAAVVLALAVAAPSLAAQFPAAVIRPESLARLDSAARSDSIRLSGGEMTDWRLADSLTSVSTGEVVQPGAAGVSFANGAAAPYTGSKVPAFALAGVAAMLAGVALIQLKR